MTLNGKSMAVDSADCSRGTKTGGLKRLTGELVCSEPSPPPSAIGFPMHTAPWFALPAYPSDLFRVVSRGEKDRERRRGGALFR